MLVIKLFYSVYLVKPKPIDGTISIFTFFHLESEGKCKIKYNIKGKLRSKNFSLKNYPFDMYLSENVNSLKKNQFKRQKNS